MFVYDFAQNMAGQTELRVVDCAAGTVITMRHAEVLFANGTIHNMWAASVPMQQQYICAGTGVETYRTFFRYSTCSPSHRG